MDLYAIDIAGIIERCHDVHVIHVREFATVSSHPAISGAVC